MTAHVPQPTPEATDLLRRVAQLEQENARLTRDLGIALEQQAEGPSREAATSEILRIIASSPTDLRPVLQAIGDRALRLFDAAGVAIHLVEGGRMVRAATFGSVGHAETNLELPLERTYASGRAVLDRQTIHLHDYAAVPEADYPLGKESQRRFGFRTCMAAPLVGEAAVVGAIAVLRTEVRPFTKQQIKLLETFADQAVIAIENTRLFQEIQDRNQDLQESNR